MNETQKFADVLVNKISQYFNPSPKIVFFFFPPLLYSRSTVILDALFAKEQSNSFWLVQIFFYSLKKKKNFILKKKKKKKKIPIREIDLTQQNPLCYEKILNFLRTVNDGTYQIPQIFINGNHIGVRKLFSFFN